MRTHPIQFRTLAATAVAGGLVFCVQAALAQGNSPPPATATRPARTLPGQTSVPSNGPPSTASQTTGEASRDPTIKKMNDDEKRKVDSKGK
jgi:hypothetical protein